MAVLPTRVGDKSYRVSSVPQVARQYTKQLCSVSCTDVPLLGRHSSRLEFPFHRFILLIGVGFLCLGISISDDGLEPLSQFLLNYPLVSAESQPFSFKLSSNAFRQRLGYPPRSFGRISCSEESSLASDATLNQPQVEGDIPFILEVLRFIITFDQGSVCENFYYLK